MITILDASAAIEIVLHRPKAPGLIQHVEDSDWVIAPSLFISEVTNVFWKYYKFGNLSMEQCEIAVEHSIALPDEFSNDKDLFREAFSIGCRVGKPIYDMFYLILARRNNGYLMTLDKSLSDVADNNSVRTVTL